MARSGGNRRRKRSPTTRVTASPEGREVTFAELEKPTNFTPRPVHAPRPELLDFTGYPSRTFERLAMAIAVRVDGLRCVRKYGTNGQRQYGIDFWGVDPENHTVVYEAKARTRFSPNEVREAVQLYVDRGRVHDADRFVLVMTAVADLKEYSDVVRALNQEHDFEVELRDGRDISEIMRFQPDLVDVYFLGWTEMFCPATRYLETEPAQDLDAVKKELDAYLEDLTEQCNELPPFLDRRDLRATSLIQRPLVTERLQWDPDVSARLTHVVSDPVVDVQPFHYEPRPQLLLRNRRPVPWDEARTDVTRAALYGDAGIGKTVLLRLEAETVAAEARAQGAAGGPLLVPVYLSLEAVCRHLVPTSPDDDIAAAIAAAVVRAMSESYEVGPALAASSLVSLSEALAEHRRGSGVRPSPFRFKLFVDGLDEVTRAHSHDAMRVVRRLLASTVDVVLVGCRQADAMALARERRSRLLALEVIGFRPTQTDAFIGTWCGDDAAAAMAVRAIVASPALAGLAHVPLLLAFVCLVASGGRIVNRSDLYERVLRHFLSGCWRDIRFQRQHELRIEEKCRLLQTIAYESMASTQRWEGGLSEAVLVDAIERLPQWQQLEDEARRLFETWRTTVDGELYPPRSYILWELEVIDGLVMRFGAPAPGWVAADVPLVFLHRTLFEYLWARHLASLPLEECLETLARHDWLDPSWSELLPLLVGRYAATGDIEAVRRVLGLLAAQHMAGDPCHAAMLHAGRCIPEMIGVPECAPLADAVAAPLVELMRQGSRGDRHRAARVLARIGKPALPMLLDAMGDDNNPVTQVAVISALAALALPDLDAELMAAFASSNADVRFAALAALDGRIGVEHLDRVESLAYEMDARIHEAAFAHVDQLDPPRARRLLENLLGDERAMVRLNAVRSARTYADGDVSALLRATLPEEPDERVRVAIVEELGRRRDVDSVPLLVAAAGARMAMAVVRAARDIGPEATPAVARLVTHFSEPVRDAAWEALAHLAADALPLLVDKAVRHRDADVCIGTIQAVDRLGIAATVSTLRACVLSDHRMVQWHVVRLLDPADELHAELLCEAAASTDERVATMAKNKLHRLDAPPPAAVPTASEEPPKDLGSLLRGLLADRVKDARNIVGTMAETVLDRAGRLLGEGPEEPAPVLDLRRARPRDLVEHALDKTGSRVAVLDEIVRRGDAESIEALGAIVRRGDYYTRAVAADAVCRLQLTSVTTIAALYVACEIAQLGTRRDAIDRLYEWSRAAAAMAARTGGCPADLRASLALMTASAAC